jgi:FixJ family two-component response regulator
VARLTNEMIAGQLGTTERTVKVHRRRVMAKIAAPSVAELVRMVAKLGPFA